MRDVAQPNRARNQALASVQAAGGARLRTVRTAHYPHTHLSPFARFPRVHWRSEPVITFAWSERASRTTREPRCTRRWRRWRSDWSSASRPHRRQPIRGRAPARDRSVAAVPQDRGIRDRVSGSRGECSSCW